MSVTGAFAAEMSDDEIINNAMSAAPETVGKNAAVMNWDMKTIREGTNGLLAWFRLGSGTVLLSLHRMKLGGREPGRFFCGMW